MGHREPLPNVVIEQHVTTRYVTEVVGVRSQAVRARQEDMGDASGEPTTPCGRWVVRFSPVGGDTQADVNFNISRAIIFYLSDVLGGAMIPQLSLYLVRERGESHREPDGSRLYLTQGTTGYQPGGFSHHDGLLPSQRLCVPHGHPCSR